MRPEDRVYLLDMLQAARLAVEYVAEVSREQFLQDIRLQDSVVRRIEVLGEAARRVSFEMREQTQQIPWTQMIAMRNVMIHEYDEVDNHIVWDTVQKDLPTLIGILTSLELSKPD